MRNKRLVRGHDQTFCGVCSGIAEYFDIDVIFVRLFILLGSIVCPAIMVFYIIMAWCMPNE